MPTTDPMTVTVTELEELIDDGKVLWVIADGGVNLMKETYTADEVVRLLDALGVAHGEEA